MVQLINYIAHFKIIILVAFIICSCNSDSVIKEENIKDIRIVRNFNPFIENVDSTISVITNTDSLKMFMSTINSAQPYLVKFFPQYKLQIDYVDTTIFILCRGNT